jgi:hypothetical protein
MRLYELLDNILFLLSWKILDILTERFIVGDATMNSQTVASGFTKSENSNITLYGNVLVGYHFLNKNSNWGTGNITNTLVNTITYTLPHAAYQYASAGGSGATGSLKLQRYPSIDIGSDYVGKINYYVDAVYSADAYAQARSKNYIRYESLM